MIAEFEGSLEDAQKKVKEIKERNAASFPELEVKLFLGSYVGES